jgi:asparagine synthetase B (glutamine-hydrolysing)
MSERPVDLAAFDFIEHDRDHLIEAVRSALGKFGRRQQGRPRALVELSGGFDSTLAAIAARTCGIELLGVSLHFPYYEFRFEEDIQESVAKSLAISRIRLDGTALLPFAPSDWWPRLDEPSISVCSLRRAVTVARLASSEDINRVLVGHGGDLLFSEDMLGGETTPSSLARGAFSKAAWREVERTAAIMESNLSFMKRSSLNLLYDARFDVTLKEAFGTTTRSPFTDLDLVRCGISWTRLSARLGRRREKSILADAFAAELPGAVTGRRGKVPWDGVCARGYALHGDSIVKEIERVRAPLERLGLDVRWLVRRVARLVGGQRSMTARDDREVIAAYALATWLHSWGVERVSDCAWSD